MLTFYHLSSLVGWRPFLPWDYKHMYCVPYWKISVLAQEILKRKDYPNSVSITLPRGAEGVLVACWVCLS